MALFLGGIFVVVVAGVNFKAERMTTAMIAICVAGGVIEVGIGALLMVTAALGKLPW